MTKGRNEFWTDDRIAELRKLARDGMSASQIGRRMGATRNAILGKAYRLGISLSAGSTKSAPSFKPPNTSRPDHREQMERKRDARDLDILDALLKGGDPAVVAKNRGLNVVYVEELWRERQAQNSVGEDA